VQEAVEASKAQGPLGSSSGHGLPQIERIRLNVHANQGIKPDRQVGCLLAWCTASTYGPCVDVYVACAGVQAAQQFFESRAVHYYLLLHAAPLLLVHICL
jgi:hypothetical protein